MDNLTQIHAYYLNYYLASQKNKTCRESHWGAFFNLALVFLFVLLCAQLLNNWRFRADARDLVSQLFLPTAQASQQLSQANVTPYTTNLVTRAEQELSISLVFTNQGSTVWPANQTTLETGPFLKSFSQVEHPSWMSFFKVMSLPVTVQPGQTITLSFKIKSPGTDVVGVIQENFQLVYNQQPINGSLARVFIDANQVSAIFENNSANVQNLTLTEKAKTVPTAVSASSSALPLSPTTVSSSDTTSNPVTVSSSALLPSNNKTSAIQYITGYNALGQMVQVARGVYVPGVSLIKPSAEAIAIEKNRLAQEQARIDQEQAQKNQNNQLANNLTSSTASNGQIFTDYAQKLSQEPNIRVGLFASDQEQRVTSDQSFSIYTQDNLLVSQVPANTVIAVVYLPTTKQYRVVVDDQVYQTNSYLRFISQVGNNGVFQLIDYRYNPNQKAELNDNKFRNILEYRHATATKQTWWINELPIDSYLRGLAETSNASPVEFQKTLVTAARTYVLYHYYRGVNFSLNGASTKHADEHFHVDATYDQVYRGYNSEIRMPRLSQAIEETSGLIVTYDNSLAITPYFSRSDGRTRNWSEVWGGSSPAWLKSVPVPEDQGKTLFGHGVGMSAQGALLMIVDSGYNWIDTLSYFYSQTTLQRAY